MAVARKPFQGVLNILRFNWHFYLFAAVAIALLFFAKNYLPQILQLSILVGGIFAAATIVVSLLVSFYVYDRSDLYQLNWLHISEKAKTLNNHSGFDETSAIIQDKFPTAEITICDFYDAKKHTEVSIKRARKVYPPNPKTIAVKTTHLPFIDETFDASLAILAAHEIRNEAERILFFKELVRVTQPAGQIIVTEHLRDLNNFLAYTIGFFHFLSRKNWLHVFEKAELKIAEEIKVTPFITTFILQKK